MTNTKTVDVPHLGGSRIGYRFGKAYDAALPTLVLVNSFTTSSELYNPQFSDERFVGKVNLLALEPYGHGETRAKTAQFTYWDSAQANLQALDQLGISTAFALGTSQGGWIVTRMAILAPDRIKGIIPLGTSMDYESEESRAAGCWDASAFCTPWIDELASKVGADWAPSDQYCNDLIDPAFGTDVAPETRAFWIARTKTNYQGDDGRHRLRMATINLRDRDDLRGRLDYVECPVLWLHGSQDVVYSVAHAEKEITRFTNARSAEFKTIEGGQHFLSASQPQAVNDHVLAFIESWS